MIFKAKPPVGRWVAFFCQFENRQFENLKMCTSTGPVFVNVVLRQAQYVKMWKCGNVRMWSESFVTVQLFNFMFTLMVKRLV